MKNYGRMLGKRQTMCYTYESNGAIKSPVLQPNKRFDSYRAKPDPTALYWGTYTAEESEAKK